MSFPEESLAFSNRSAESNTTAAAHSEFSAKWRPGQSLLGITPAIIHISVKIRASFQTQNTLRHFAWPLV